MSLNPRFVAYARSLGKTPEEALQRDAAGIACMSGYIWWIGERWVEWRKLRGYSANRPPDNIDHKHFDVWLATYPKEE